MCGIFAAISYESDFGDEDYRKFCECTDIVNYRGPDDSGYLAFDDNGITPAGSRFKLFLGHRRLAILDLSAAGHQPMTDGKGLWLTYNGEIFNFIELREHLKKLGHTFTSSTDTEVILKLYREYGEAGFARMNGMWAMVLVDLPRGRVIASRDRFSMKPLYMARKDRVVYFASEIKQIAGLLPSLQPNLAVISRFIDQALYCDSPDTFYEGVKRIPGATNLCLDLNSRDVVTTRYWDFDPTQAADHGGDTVEKFRELLIDSIRIRLRSDVKVGVLLSGGLDSTAITSLLHGIGTDLDTYSVVSDGPCSEDRFIDIVNRTIGCKGMKIAIRPDGVLDALNKVLYHHDEPIGGFNVVAQFLMMQVIRRESDCTVLLSGQGADEVLLGYLKYFFFLLRDLWHTRDYGAFSGEILGAFLNRTIWEQFSMGKARRYRARVGAREFIRSDAIRLQLGNWQSVRESQKADIERFSIPALTHYEDRSAMAFGLEVRHPFLDHRLVEYAVSLPASEKIHRGWLKYLLRHGIPEMPPEVRWRRDKQGFVVPEDQWLKNDLAQTVELIFANSVLEELGLLDARSFLSFYRRFRAGSGGIWHNEITRIVITELWARQFRECRQRHELEFANNGATGQIACGDLV